VTEPPRNPLAVRPEPQRNPLASPTSAVLGGAEHRSERT
jgi:hypothetical protein